MRSLVTVIAVSVVTAAAVALTGCSSVDVATEASIAVDVTQGRTDRDARIVVMDVTNLGDSAIELSRAQLDTPQFAAPAVWSRGTTLAAGATVSLRAELDDPVCPVPIDAEPKVTVDFVSGSGSPVTVTMPPTQSTDVLAIIARDDCVGVLAAQHAEVTVAETVRFTPGAHQPALLDLVMTPTGAEGSLALLAARSTNLLSLVDDSGANTEQLPLGIISAAGSPEQRVTLRLVPARCDPHAIAEDKRGTIMVLDVETRDGAGLVEISGTAYYRSSDDVKAALYAFVADYCA